MQEVEVLKQNKTFDSSITKAFKKVASNPLLLAFIFNMLAFLLCILLFDIKYEVSDDYITDAVLSGAFGTGYDPQLLFGNVILGYFLVFLYKLIPTISFYFLLLISLDFISVTVVLYLLFKKKINSITVCIALLFLLFFSDDLYILIQFTKVASVAGIAGGLLILHGLWETDNHKVRYIVFGSLLMIVASMVRFETIYIYAAFLVLSFLCSVVIHIRKKRKNGEKTQGKVQAKHDVIEIGVRFSVCVLVIGMLFGINYFGRWLCCLDETYIDFNNFHGIRCSITDNLKPSFATVNDEYNELGLDFIDYAMLCSWDFVDREVYSDELIQEVAEIHKNAVSKTGISFDIVVETLVTRQTLMYPAACALIIFVGLSLLFCNNRIYPILLLFSSILMFIGFVYYGRIMYRVEWSVYFCAASCVISAFSVDENSIMIKIKKKNNGLKGFNVGLYIIVFLVLLISFVPDIVTKYQLLNCTDLEYRISFANSLAYSSEYVPGKVGFPTISRKISPNLIKYMENDTEHYYMVDFGTGIQDLYFNYEPWIRPEQGLFEKYSYYGGCTMHHPGECSVLIANGADPDNPFKSLTNDNIYLIDNWGYEYKILYIRRYFSPDAKIKFVDEIDGYKIWKVYIPDNIDESNVIIDLPESV